LKIENLLFFIEEVERQPGASRITNNKFALMIFNEPKELRLEFGDSTLCVAIGLGKGERKPAVRGKGGSVRWDLMSAALTVRARNGSFAA
jgi:hypothetical protein